MSQASYSGPGGYSTEGLRPGSRLYQYMRQKQMKMSPEQLRQVNQPQPEQSQLSGALSTGIQTGFAQTPGQFDQGMSNVATQGQQFWEQLLAQHGGDAQKAMQAAQPYLQQIGGLQEAVGNYFGNTEMQSSLNQAADQADPFSEQRPQYQDQLSSTYSDPDWVKNDAGLSGFADDSYIKEYGEQDFSEQYGDEFIQDYANTDIMGKLGDETYLQQMNDRIQNDVAKQMSSKGFMNSGNYGMDLGRRLQQEIAPMSYQQQKDMANIRGSQAANVANMHGSRNEFLSGLSANQAATVADLQRQRRESILRGVQQERTFLGNMSGAQFGPANAANLRSQAADAGRQARTGSGAGIGYSAQQQTAQPQKKGHTYRYIANTKGL